MGINIAESMNIPYLPSDFKKNNGYLRSTELSEEYELYRQHYCGCIFGARDQGIDLAEVEKEAKEFMKNRNGEKDFPGIDL